MSHRLASHPSHEKLKPLHAMLHIPPTPVSAQLQKRAPLPTRVFGFRIPLAMTQDADGLVDYSTTPTVAHRYHGTNKYPHGTNKYFMAQANIFTARRNTSLHKEKPLTAEVVLIAEMIFAERLLSESYGGIFPFR